MLDAFEQQQIECRIMIVVVRFEALSGALGVDAEVLHDFEDLIVRLAGCCAAQCAALVAHDIRTRRSRRRIQRFHQHPTMPLDLTNCNALVGLQHQHFSYQRFTICARGWRIDEREERQELIFLHGLFVIIFLYCAQFDVVKSTSQSIQLHLVTTSPTLSLSRHSPELIKNGILKRPDSTRSRRI